ncbi:carboxymuconolactone decarboxylase family protein [Acholeplasma vituli]|uniref:Carboxymuconolactone decarboxylase family protein n=1 Tax=Paracholeplasma vituli TaxID=69473 RepID=A0ABT2PY40_9MOLU|nr:carboxymuconolactone decarboxylase family protein [Paracholeplasma vituli]MCU0105663.1 carboxymuconolactone decarboxylase family protein [Paracholeplasma vituli]
MSFEDKRKFGFFEHLPIIVRAARSFLYLRLFKKKNGMNFKFKERIMLAVTEVNGCTICSFVHTKLALKAGLTQDDIQELLAGELVGVPKEEALGVLFAKDYAFNKETIDPAFYQKLVDTYNIRKARAVLGVSEMITMTNSMGLALGYLKRSLSFKHVKGSNILNEIFIPLSTMVLFPLLLVLFLPYIPFYSARFKNK